MRKPRVRMGEGKNRLRRGETPANMAGPSVTHGVPNGMSDDQHRELHALIALLKQYNLAELELERKGFRVRLRREIGSAAGPGEVKEAASAVQPVKGEGVSAPVAQDASGLMTIRSPIVGTFYRSPSPDADPYVEEEDLVKKGQVLCIVEAMKLMNEIESEVDGRIVEILAESAKPVEYGQPLFLIDPSPAS